MIYYADLNDTPAAAHVEFAPGTVEATLFSQTVTEAAGEVSLQHLDASGDAGRAEEQSVPMDVVEEIDWTDARQHRLFARLEGRYLAKKCSPDESQQYRTMKQSRDAFIFSKTYVQDYAEEQRLRLLAEKLADIEHYLRPLSIR